MKKYVINLKAATDRREHIIKEFGNQNIPFEFFDAITIEQINSLCQHLNLTNLQHNSLLTDGEKACFLSHVCLWQKMLDEDIKYLAIFEDDIILGENAFLFLEEDDWIQNYHLIKLEVFDEIKIMSKQKHPIKNNRNLAQLNEAHLGAAGYILSQKISKLLLSTIKQEINIMPLDDLIFDKYPFGKKLYTLYQIIPAICIQSDRVNKLNIQSNTILTSQLAEDRNNAKVLRKKYNENKIPIFKKMIREIRRLLMSLHRYCTKKSNTIGFK